MTSEAELYALVHRGTPGDLSFYLRAARGARKVLELGCGYGRLLGPLAEVGPTVVGLERDEGLLALAHESLGDLPKPARNRLTLVHGDMRCFDLTERFDRVLIPYSGIYCLTSEPELLSCLRHVAEHLTPDGLLVWDAYAVDAFHAGANPTDADYTDADPDGPVITVQWNDKVYDVYEQTEWERDLQRLNVEYVYRPRGGGTPYQVEIAHRYLLTHQLESVNAKAGLRIVETFGDFAGAPLSVESEHMVCVARKR